MLLRDNLLYVQSHPKRTVNSQYSTGRRLRTICHIQILIIKLLKLKEKAVAKICG